MTNRYSIKDLEQLSGIKAHTIRIWEQRYKLITPKRTETNIRYYLDSDLKKLLNISVLIKKGIKISKISQLSNEEIQALVLEYSRYRGEYEAQINGLKMAMIDFDVEYFEKILGQCFFTFGPDVTFTQILGKFIAEIGILWQTNSISIAHEHFISNLIKQKLFAAIDQMIVTPKPDTEPIVLYLPDNELHELSLLYIYYTLKKKGYRVLYLGQSVPAENLKELFDKTGRRLFISIFTSNPFSEEVEDYIKKLDELFGENDCWFHFTGYQVQNVTDLNFNKERFHIHPSVESICDSF
ncbi:MerR family transcriptional regulator [Thermaurantimonas aggregans]|uniref:MerR family transcriptional regulator n=1 Tax=Thermaurantimonas aggregans TaxID=2173829 RepID=A0A401XNF0_9FLAO|nr:MerR family transcriptional regulator [Thermaurantimonas aggregans]MCX8147649.1 MerR family transcriptional regulator [Thermaurantimonas aggregans]GCD78548.1 MerR family transcriptional regulator [Thermaurantimonas aggregans]